MLREKREDFRWWKKRMTSTVSPMTRTTDSRLEIWDFSQFRADNRANSVIIRSVLMAK
jgi:hypothetical protein